MGNNSKWYHFLMGEKNLNTSGKLIEKQKNGQNDCSRQNARIGICVVSNTNQHHCTNICNMNVEGSLGTDWVDKLLLKSLNNNSRMIQERHRQPHKVSRGGPKAYNNNQTTMKHNHKQEDISSPLHWVQLQLRQQCKESHRM